MFPRTSAGEFCNLNWFHRMKLGPQNRLFVSQLEDFTLTFFNQCIQGFVGSNNPLVCLVDDFFLPILP